MKQLAIALTLAASVFTTSSFANDGIGTPVGVLKSFQTTFAAAKDADWTSSEEFYKVKFALDGQYITAFYRADGTMAALTRNISFFQLPVSLQANLKNEYKQYWIAGLFELSNDESVEHYVTLEDADTRLVLKSASAKWSAFQKERKN